MKSGNCSKFLNIYLCAKLCHIILSPFLDDACQGRRLDIKSPTNIVSPCLIKFAIYSQSSVFIH